MPIGIVRFGGNSFRNKRILNAFCHEIRQSKNNLVIVVSAIPQIKNILNDGLQKLTKQTISYNTIIDQINQDIDSIGTFSPNDRTKLSDEISRLEGVLNGIQLTGDYSLALRDSVFSFSERISALWLSGYLSENNIQSV